MVSQFAAFFWDHVSFIVQNSSFYSTLYCIFFRIAPGSNPNSDRMTLTKGPSSKSF